MNEKKAKLHYRYSCVWVIFWAIVFFPIALALLLTGSSFEWDQSTYVLAYDGSRFWLCFWVLFFFPIAFLLLFLNGFSVTVVSSEQKRNLTH